MVFHSLDVKLHPSKQTPIVVGLADRWLGVAILLAAFALRVSSITFQSLWRDEVDALRFAMRDLPSLVAGLTTIGENGPLYYLVLRGWVELVGPSELGLRSLSLLAGMLAVALTHAVGRRLLGRATAVTGLLLAAVSPFWIWYSQEAKMYAIFTALALAWALCFLRARASGRWRDWIGYVVVTSLALYTHIFAVLLVILGLLLAAFWPPAGRAGRLRMSAALAALVLPYLPLAVWQAPTLLQPPPSGYPPAMPTEMAAALLFAFVLGGTPGWAMASTAAFLFALLTGTLFGEGERGKGRTAIAWPVSVLPGRGIGVLLIWLVVPVLLVWLVSSRFPVFAERYLIFVSPACYLLAAAGLVAVWRRARPVAVLAGGIVLVGMVAATWHFATTPTKADFRSAARYVRLHQTAGEPLMFVMPYARYTFAYYYARPLTERAAPYTNSGLDPGEVDRSLRAQLGGVSSLWLIEAEPEQHDRLGQVRAWLDGRSRRTDQANFVGLRVSRYVLAE